MTHNRTPITYPTDLHAPGAIEQLIAFHRQTFGGWTMKDGDGGDGGDGGQGDGTGDGSGDNGAGDGAAGDDGDGNNNDGDDSPWADPKAAQAEIERLRKENASSRVKGNTAAQAAAEKATADMAQTIGKAIGLIKDGDDAPTVEALTKQLADQTGQTSEARNSTRDTKAELVVWQNATDLKVDAKALTDSRAFEKAIKDLDPASDTFAADVKTAAQEALKNNPKLAAGRASGSSSIDHPGGGDAPRRTQAPSIADAVSSALGS